MINKKRFATLIYASIILPLLATECLSQTYYVSQSGSNKNPGTSWNSAWKTLQHAGKKAIAGDTVIIRAGQVPYKYLPILNSGSEGKPIIFRGESPTDKPVITGAKQVTNWKPGSTANIWTSASKQQPTLLIQDKLALKKASSPECLDGNWYWHKGRIYLKTTEKHPDKSDIWRSFAAGGAVIRSQSWIELHDLHFWFGGGAGVSIRHGNHIKLKNLTAQWHWIGIDINGKSSHNLIDGCVVKNNGAGVYLRLGASHNTVKNCLATKNGNLPWWTKGDRPGIGIGEKGPNIGNIIEDNEVSYNGGPYSDPGLMAYDAPNTILRRNNVHHNYGYGLFVTIASHHTLVEDNKILSNGIPAVQAKLKGMSGFGIRHSHDVVVKNNLILDNHVSSDSRWPGKMLGPKGGLDIRGHRNQNMTNLKFINNKISGTIGGPNVYIDKKANLSGLLFEPVGQSPL